MRIALSQINPIIGDIKGNNKKIISFIETAKKKGAELVIFPELAIIGYPPVDLLMYNKLINDNITSIKAIAGYSHEIAIICGYVEYDHENPPMLYNAAAFMTDGKIASKHYKSLLPTYDVFDEQRYFSTGRIHEPVIFKDRIIGITVCEDIWNDDCYNKQRTQNKQLT